MRQYRKLFLVISLLFALLFTGTVVAKADWETEASGSGGGCIITSQTVEEIQETPLVCTGTVAVFQNMGEAEEEGKCYFGYTFDYDCETGDITAARSGTGFDNAYTIADCNTGDDSGYNSCEINKWTGQFVCGFWKWNLYVQAGLPCATLDIEPYPVTLVRWPTYLRFSGAGSSSASAHLDFVGRGTEDDPMPGDQRDIRLVLTVKPLAPQMQVHLPRAGYYQGDGQHCPEAQNFALPLQNSSSPPRTAICWNVPSHPAAGAGPLAGNVLGMDELASDFPLFDGWARVPYMAGWQATYEEWDVVERNCELGPARWDEDGHPVYECKTPGSTWKNGHWVNIYDWKRHSEGGVIDPAVVEDFPQSLLADLNGDGRPDGFWSYNVRIRRMDEAWNVHNPVYHREWPCRPHVYFAVREGQTQSIYFPNASP